MALPFLHAAGQDGLFAADRLQTVNNGRWTHRPRTKADDMDAVPPKERRTVTRSPGDTISPVRLCLEEGDIVASVQDISITGVGILTRQLLEPGTSFVLKPGKPGRRLSPALKAEVRHTRKYNKDEGEYLVGCRFSRLLTTEDYMAFG